MHPRLPPTPPKPTKALHRQKDENRPKAHNFVKSFTFDPSVAVDTSEGISNGKPVEKRNQPPKTIRELLRISQAWLAERKIESARLDTELLLAHALGESRVRLYMDLDRPLTPAELDVFRPLLARRGKREPVAYILGEKEFYGLPFEVGPDVLVPRPDTERVVELVLETIAPDVEGTVVDVCTGSGCIAIAIAKERPKLRVIATDLSPGALAVASRNVARHDLGNRVEIREGDLLAPVQTERDVLGIVGNPPYIRPDDRASLEPDVKDYEPEMALFGLGSGSVGHHAQILAQAGALLCADGFVLLEAGHDQENELCALPHDGFSSGTLFRDLGNRVRGAFWRKLPV